MQINVCNLATQGNPKYQQQRRLTMILFCYVQSPVMVYVSTIYVSTSNGICIILGTYTLATIPIVVLATCKSVNVQNNFCYSYILVASQLFNCANGNGYYNGNLLSVSSTVLSSIATVLSTVLIISTAGLSLSVIYVMQINNFV